MGSARFLEFYPLSEIVSLLVEITNLDMDIKRTYLLKRQSLISEVPACRISEYHSTAAAYAVRMTNKRTYLKVW